MSKVNFMEKIKKLFGINIKRKSSKKEEFKILLKKLEHRRRKLKTTLKRTKKKKDIAEIKNTIALLKKQIKKGEKILKN